LLNFFAHLDKKNLTNISPCFLKYSVQIVRVYSYGTITDIPQYPYSNGHNFQTTQKNIDVLYVKGRGVIGEVHMTLENIQSVEIVMTTEHPSQIGYQITNLDRSFNNNHSHRTQLHNYF